ncbi:hypothetical protein Tco_1073606 [Tanacetum coccineum]
MFPPLIGEIPPLQKPFHKLETVIEEEEETMVSVKKRKPLFNLTNHVRTTPPTPSPGRMGVFVSTDDWVRDGNRVASSRRLTSLKTRSKTKAAAIPVYHASLEKTKNDSNKAKNNMEDVRIPMYGVKLHGNKKQVVVSPSPPMKNVDNMDLLFGEKSKDNEKANVESSSLFELTEKYNENEFATPLNRIEVEGTEKESHSKSSTDTLPNTKNKKCSSKGSSREYVVPHEFIRQLRAYYKEIDEYELEVEEVE